MKVHQFDTAEIKWSWHTQQMPAHLQEEHDDRVENAVEGENGSKHLAPRPYDIEPEQEIEFHVSALEKGLEILKS